MMNNQGLKWLAGACGLMLMVLLMEWMIFGASESQSIELLENIKEPQTTEMELPKLGLDKQSAEKYISMVENPLFIEGRNPVPEDEPKITSQVVSKIDDLGLVGIYSVDDQIVALFTQKGSDKKSLKKVEGDDISGWLVKEIRLDKVILEQAGKEEIIVLRSPKPKHKVQAKAKKKPVAKLNPFTQKIIN